MEIKNKIICGNCIDIMKNMPNDYIDLIVTSLPYDNLRDYKGFTFDFEKIANELFRIIKNGGVVVWIVNDETINGSESGTSFKQALYFKEIGFKLYDTMIYLKDSISFPSKHRYSNCFEYMFILSKNMPKTINLIKDHKNIWVGKKMLGNDRQKNGELTKKGGHGKPLQEYGVRFNYWKYSTGYMKSTSDLIAYKHPAIFPEKLAQDHILSWSNENDLILDPMCGSGTVPKMCQLTKRNFIGIDISSEYCKIAKKRISETNYVLFG